MGGTSFTVEIVDRLEPITEEWNDLACDVGATPFVHPGWTTCWWSAFGRGALRLFVARHQDRLVAVLPMGYRRGALRSPTNAHTPVFDLLAGRPAATTALADELFATRANEIEIGPLDETGSTLPVLTAAAQAAGYRVFVEPAKRAPYIPGASTLTEHRRSLSHNIRHDAERRLRRLLETGAVSVQVSDGRERLDDLLDEGFAVEAASWKGAKGTAILSRPSTDSFYRGVAHWAGSLGWLRLAFLRLDGRAIAFQFDLESGRTYYSLKIGYDPAYERFSPGKLLAYAMVSRAVATGLAGYELLGTDEAWKYRWTNRVHERVVVRAFAPSAAGLLAWSSRTRVRPLARRVPFAQRLANAIRR
jgi:CelD/BcsL family acetyltransferase involved in cellulose biosynthesis